MKEHTEGFQMGFYKGGQVAKTMFWQPVQDEVQRSYFLIQGGTAQDKGLSSG